VKYRDAGHRPATGRAGGVVVSSRALLGRDGTTAVELWVGDAAGAASGGLRHVQVRAHEADPARRATWNVDARGASSHQLSLPGLPRGALLRLQANVQGATSPRTAVVTLLDTVWLRPDLMVVDVVAPLQAVAGVPVLVTATVRERNGDVGTRASCILEDGGTPVDSVSGMWVDAGSAVSCEFTRVFPGAGTRVLTARVSGADPADDDSSNDAASATVEVVAQVPTSFRAVVIDDSVVERSSGTDQFVASYTLYYEASGWSTVSHGHRQSARMDAWTPGATTLPDEPLRDVQLELTSDGTLVAAASWDVVPVSDFEPRAGMIGACARRATDAPVIATIAVCTWRLASGGTVNTSVTLAWNAGDVTYQSVHGDTIWCSPSSACAGHEYRWNVASRELEGSPVRFGAEFGLRFAFLSGDRLMHAEASVPLARWSYVFESNQPSCFHQLETRSGRPGRLTWCRTYRADHWMTSGDAQRIITE
jgi:hypothetical protein